MRSEVSSATDVIIPKQSPVTKTIPSVILSSLLILIPCFWQAHIQANDLPSHVYNAWLYSLAVTGKVSGLAIGHPITNVLVDEMLYRFLIWGSAWWAEHLMVGIGVLVFFWGAFRFLTAATGRRPWNWLPVLAMLTYGVVFRWGFFNFYYSIGFSLWAASFALRKQALNWLWAAVFWCLALVAHASGAAWIAAILVYVYLFQHATEKQRTRLFAVAIGAVLLGILALPIFIRCDWPDYWLGHIRLYAGFIGVGQLAPYGRKYWIISGAVLIGLAGLFLRLWRNRKELSLGRDVFWQLLVLHILISVVTPMSLYFPSFPPGVSFSVINDRLSLLTALIALALLAKFNLSKAELGILSGFAVLFFVFAFTDEASLNRIERELDAALRQVPTHARVVMMVAPEEPRGILLLMHQLDRPCIGRCYDYANYEPATRQFRLRAFGPNDVVLSAETDVDRVAGGTYIAKPADLPLYAIHLCPDRTEHFCIQSVSAGELLKLDHLPVL